MGRVLEVEQFCCRISTLIEMTFMSSYSGQFDETLSKYGHVELRS